MLLEWASAVACSVCSPSLGELSLSHANIRTWFGGVPERLKGLPC